MKERGELKQDRGSLHRATAYGSRTGCLISRKAVPCVLVVQVAAAGRTVHMSHHDMCACQSCCEVCFDEQPCVTEHSISLLVICRIATSKAWQEEKPEEHPTALTKHAAASLPLQNIKNAPWVSTISNADSNCSHDLCMHH